MRKNPLLGGNSRDVRVPWADEYRRTPTPGFANSQSPLLWPLGRGFRGVWELPRPVALDLVGLLEGRAVDPLDQRLRDRPDGLELDRVRAHLVAGAAFAVGR